MLQGFDWQQLYAVDANITMCANTTAKVPFVPAALQQYIIQGFVGGCMSQSGYEARPSYLDHGPVERKTRIKD